MFDDLASQYHEDVVAAFVEFRERNGDGIAGRSRDLRSALSAASALFHFREHLPASCSLSRSEAERLCPDFGLLGDIANAAKHRTLSGGTPHGSPLVTTAENLREEVSFIHYTDEAGTYGCGHKDVVAKLADGSERNVLEVLTNVINFWDQYLARAGILASARTFVNEDPLRFRSRAECEGKGLNFEMVQGQRFKQHVRWFRFDNISQKAEPVILTGSEIIFTVRRPRLSLEVSAVHAKTGRTLSATVALTADESEAWSALATDADREAFIVGLPAAQAALAELRQRGLDERVPGVDEEHNSSPSSEDEERSNGSTA